MVKEKCLGIKLSFLCKWLLKAWFACGGRRRVLG
jgi:hypothetical protein